MLHCVIMAGGFGTRLWPESRADRPKQFLKLLGNETMLAATRRRVAPIVLPEHFLIATGESMTSLVHESLLDLASGQILAEPAPRNTAPCIGLAALKILRTDPDATMLVLPADQAIRDEARFCQAVGFAETLVRENPNRLVTFGIKPSSPSTSYGYIELGEPITGDAAAQFGNLTHANSVERFHEKPDAEKAKNFLATGQFLWNAGIFVWKARTILEQIERFEPEIGERLRRIDESFTRNDFMDVLRTEFIAMKKISIDYAVMERASDIVVVEAPFDWDDVGTWSSLERVQADKRDANGNLADNVQLRTFESRNNIVRSCDPNRVIALVGVENLIVVQTADATLIVRKDQEEMIRNIVSPEK